MKIHTTARHCELTPETRQFVHQRLERLLRYFRSPRDAMEAHVVVGAEKYRHIAEITLKLRRGEVVSREEANDPRAAIEQAAERLEHRIRRIKEKRLSRKRDGHLREIPPPDSSSVTDEDMLDEYLDEPAEEAGQGGVPRGECYRVHTLSVARLFEDQRQDLQLESLGESLASRREITVSDIHRPGMALMGFVENFLPERIQIIAQTELTYLATLSPERVREAIDRLFQFEMPLIVVAKGLEVPPYLIERANQCQVPVLRTGQSTTPFIHSLTSYLDHMFAPQVSVHGSLVDVYGCGLLFTGSSAIGKSETALDLVERGHRLVADDVVTITRRHGDVLIGSGNQLLRHHMEIRGLGIIDVQTVFGIRSIRLQKRVEVEVNLREWSSEEDYERLGLDDRKSTFLDIEIPLVQVPITPGKNITVIAEVIALNYLVKVYGGYSPAERLNQHLIELMKRKSAARAWVREDTE